MSTCPHGIWNPLSRAFDWYMYGSDPRRGGGAPRGGPSFWGGVSKTLLGHSFKILNISSESSAQAQSIGTLSSKLSKGGGVCGHVL